MGWVGEGRQRKGGKEVVRFVYMVRCMGIWVEWMGGTLSRSVIFRVDTHHTYSSPMPWNTRIHDVISTCRKNTIQHVTGEAGLPALRSQHALHTMLARGAGSTHSNLHSV